MTRQTRRVRLSSGRLFSMDIIYLLLSLSVVLVCVIVVVFIWAVNHDQFDDLEGPGYRILSDDDSPISPDQNRQ